MRSAVINYLLGIGQQAAPAQQAPGGAAGLLGSPFVLMILMFGVFYFLVIRPQSKKAKLHQQMLSELKAGDDIVTSGGMIGRITGIKDDQVTLEVQQGVRIRILRSAISGKQRVGEPAKSEAKAPTQSPG